MTACVDNKEKKGGAAKAVSATLAGVLAVGMVPAVAFATEGEAATEGNGDTSLLAVNDDAAWKNGKITAAVDTDGKTLTGDALDNIEFVAKDGVAQYVTPTEFTPDMKDAVDVEGYTFKYYEVTIDEDGNVTKGSVVQPSAITGVGDYGVAVVGNPTNDGTTAESENLLVFSIVANDLSRATIYSVNSEDPEDTSDTTIEWAGGTFTDFGFGAKGDLGLVLDGKIVDSADYTATIYKDSVATTGTDKVAVGNYTVVIKGADDSIYEGESVTLSFEILPLDLESADIELAVTNYKTMPTVATINDIAVADLGGAAAFTVDVVSSPNGDILDGTLGEYKYSVVKADEKNANITGTGEVTLINAQNTTTAVNFIKYDGAELPATYKVDHSLEADSAGWKAEDFDLSLITCEIAKKDVPLIVTVEDKDGNVVSNSSVTTPGTWTVRVKIDSANCDYKYAGEKTVEVTVREGSIEAAADVFVQYDGGLISGTSSSSYKQFPYSGEDLMEAINVVVKTEDATLVEGTDYTVEYLNEEDEAVTEMVNAGKYKIVVKSGAYQLDADDTTYIEITTINLTTTNTRIDPSTQVDFTNDETDDPVYPYTGSDITPVFQYNTGEKDAEGEEIWATIPADAYKVTYQLKQEDGTFKAVDTINAAGEYKITISDITSTEPEAGNYTIATPIEINATVSDQALFSDVPNNQWYSTHVYNAVTANYMEGYESTTLFGPNDNISRGQVATVLFRMAGGQVTTTDTATDIFDDVTVDMYYAKPIAWAYQTGIVTGYESGDKEGLFCPDNSTTREEFLVMLYRYAEKTGQLGDTEAADLSAFVDGASVSDWAAEAVAWAVGAGLVGGYEDTGVLGPQNTITRAQVAKIVTTLQESVLTDKIA